jgi:hypothetical protein
MTKTVSARDSDRQPMEPRLAAFCSERGPDVFHSVSHRHEIWREDPYDVETIHGEARAAFERLVDRATTPPGLPAGRILLILGESGSGKTHLMRAFRNQVHRQQLGYCGYMQMTSHTDNYGRYILSNLIDSLDQLYFESGGESSGLLRLAGALAETPHAILRADLIRLRELEPDSKDLGRQVNELADLILADERYARLDLDLIRALLYLQRDDPRIKSRVLKYLRCEDLADHDREVLGGIVPRRNPEDAQRMVELLGRLMWSVQSACLVLCLDQLEEMHTLAGAAERFRRSMATLCAIADQVPSSIVVISCLADYYETLKGSLTRPVVDRIERDPDPIHLISRRRESEINELVKRRLMVLYEELDAPFVAADPTYPFPATVLKMLQNLRTRDVLDWCRDFREKCIRAGRLVPFPRQAVVEKPGIESTPVLSLEQTWNDFRAGFAAALPEGDDELAGLLAVSLSACSDEIATGHRFVTEARDNLLSIEQQGPTGVLERLMAGVCNKSALGGSLGKQIRDLVEQAGKDRVILVRSTAFPGGRKTKVADQISTIIKQGGRRVLVENSDWRTLAAFRDFRLRHDQDPAWKQWLRAEKPLSRLKSLRDILGLDHLRPAAERVASPHVAPPASTEQQRPATLPPTPKAVPHQANQVEAPSTHEGNVAGVRVPTGMPDAGVVDSRGSSTPPNEPEPLGVGLTGGQTPASVFLDLRELTCHMAFLGGSGSGKTTLALHIIEELLLRGIPAVLVDRKGDLCGYARQEFWTQPLNDPEREMKRARLRERVEVALYTPGHPGGYPLSIPLIPVGMDQLPAWERELMAGYAAFALGSMMGYKDKGQEGSRIAILRQAIHLLSETPRPAAVSLRELIDFVQEPDPALLTAIGQLDTKLFRRLVDDLETLRMRRGELLALAGRPLETEALLGLGVSARLGKTRLSIVSTKFLGDHANIEFWVAQLLLETARWASKHPHPDLQAVFLFDEADMYLPAQRKPATKEPMESLLKRARSAGIGLLLASQSPGDFDYKCRDNIRTWFLGRITQSSSLAKMKPMLSDYPMDLTHKLPHQQTGEFHLARDKGVTRMRAHRSLLVTEQLAEEEILRLARSSAGSNAQE